MWCVKTKQKNTRTQNTMTVPNEPSSQKPELPRGADAHGTRGIAEGAEANVAGEFPTGAA